MASLAAAIAGILTAVQARVVGEFSALTTNGPQFIVANYVIGLALLTVLVLTVTPARRGIIRLISLVRAGTVHWYQLFGGVLGAWLVVSQFLTVPRIGVALSVVSLVAGLLVASILVDRAGWGPAGPTPPTRPRIIGAALALVAVSIEVAPSVVSQGWSVGSAPFVLLALSAGCGVAVQQALNGRIAAAAGQPLPAGWLNFATGALALGSVVTVLALTGAVPLVPLPSSPWWIYTPGLLGATFVTLAAWAIRYTGVLRLGLLSLSGQLIAAFVFDVIRPMEDLSTGTRTAVATVLAIGAVVASNRTGRRPLPNAATADPFS